MLFSYLRSKATVVSASLALGCAALSSTHAAGNLKLHVPSPDWRDQIIYFLMTDRFEDGNPKNNDQGAGEFNPQKESHYSGGDLAGVRKRLDYIQGLGATSVWITPPVANQWWNGEYGGYHGYWAADFKRLDAHVGSLKDYQLLSDALHRKGMYLVQDIVLNHTGDFFRYKNWQPQNPAQGFEFKPKSVPMQAPTQAPFHLNDARNPAHRAAAIYHWTPDVSNYNDRQQELNFQMSGLDDLNSENPVVRRALRDSYGHWIRKVGVDAFRLDTAFFVPPDAVQDFLYAKDTKHPGMRIVAQQTGRKDFMTFGEGFAIDKAGETKAMAKIETYVRDARSQAVMQGMLNFPLYGSVGDVMARGGPTHALGERIRQMMRVHSDPHRMPSFIDNHDVDRFLKGGSDIALRQSLALIMTLPGIPTLYYGTEQGFKEQRAAMFAAGYGAGGKDHFDTQSPLYLFTQSLTKLRKQYRVLSRGVPTVLRDDAAGAGVLAYRMDHAGQSAWVIFNTAEHEVLLDNLDLMQGLPAQQRPHALNGVWGASGAEFKRPTDVPNPATSGAGGLFNLSLPPRSTMIWVGSVKPSAAAATAVAPLKLQLPTDLPAQVTGDFDVAADWTLPASSDIECLWVVNGDLKNAQVITPIKGLSTTADKTAITRTSTPQWQLRVDTSRWTDATAQRVVLLARHAQSKAVVAVSAPAQVHLKKDWQLVASVDDPVGDDHGPQGRYVYPQDPTYVPGTFDIEKLEVWTAGKSLRLKLKMGVVNRSWNPANGFDHVAFTVLIGKPDASNSLRVMPMQQDNLPEDSHWHYRLRAHGWSNALFTAQGAHAKAEGVALPEGAKIQVDIAARTVQFDLPASLLADVTSLKGLKLSVNTWDYDNGYRKLSPQGGGSEVGGGLADMPLWMDRVSLELNP
jgi:glycosidase